MPLHTYDTIRTMQVLQLAVSRGFTRWTGGRVRYDRAEALLSKFAELYTVNPTRAQDMRLRRAEHARSRLVLHAQEHEIHFAWWLLVSQGAGTVVQRETLADAADRKQRITLGAWELLRVPKRQTREAVAWTWRLPEQDFRDRLAHACAIATYEQPHQAQELMAAMAKWPGYHGISQQRQDIWDAMLAARRAAGRRDALERPAHPPWPRLLKLHGHGVPLEIAVERMRLAVAGDVLR